MSSDYDVSSFSFKYFYLISFQYRMNPFEDRNSGEKIKGTPY